MAKQKSIDGANLQLALKQNNEKMKGYIDASHYDIKKYQKYVNTELDYCYLRPNITVGNIAISEGFIVPFIVHNGNMEYNPENYSVKLKGGKTYKIEADMYVFSEANYVNYILYDITNNVELYYGTKISVSLNNTSSSDLLTYIYTPENDCEIQIKISTPSKSMKIEADKAYFSVQEINRQITIDPVEHVNESHGIEDTPVGHIISHMGTVAPKHYLACNGSEYNIEDYPYLAQHFKDNFGSINYFGGDGITTFAIPNKNNLYTESVPAMKSNNSPFPYVVSASSNYSGRPPYYAFNKTNSNASDLWTCLLNDNNPWIQIYSPDGVNISKFSITSRNGDDTATGYRPKIISLVGSDNEVDWVTLLDTTEVTWNGSNQTLEFILDNMYKFKYIRLYLYSNNKYTEIGRFDIYKTENIQCIKYEPTYFMNTYNTNYMQPSMYSEEERVVGSWIDGKPLYEKVVKVTMPNKTIGTSTPHGIENLDTLTNFSLNWYDSEDKAWYDRFRMWISSSTNYSISNELNINSKNINITPNGNNIIDWSSRTTNAFCKLQYTKTTDEPNSFTNSMLKESYVKLDSTCTDEELQQAIADIVEEINADPVIEPEQSIADIPVTIPEIYEEDEPGDEVIEEPEATPEEEMTEPEEVTPEVTDEPETEQTEVTEGGTNNESE